MGSHCKILKESNLNGLDTTLLLSSLPEMVSSDMEHSVTIGSQYVTPFDQSVRFHRREGHKQVRTSHPLRSRRCRTGRPRPDITVFMFLINWVLTVFSRPSQQS